MKKVTHTILITIFYLSFCLTNAIGQIKSENEVVYIRCSNLLNRKFLASLEKEVNTKEGAMFDKFVYCGPKFFQQYEHTSLIENILDGKITFEIPNKTNQKINFKEGKLIQKESDYKNLLIFLQKEFFDHSPQIRKLNEEEKKYYWSIIFFDIKEPIYIIEARGKKLIIDADEKMKISFIELF